MQLQLTKQEVIEEMTRRLVEFYRPVRIYLFGSEARGEAGPDSDLDFPVVVPDIRRIRYCEAARDMRVSPDSACRRT